jgi:SAM-dependent methyltransferase
MTYKPREYWETRLSRDFSLGATGHIGFSRYYNRFMYKLKAHVLEEALKRHKIKVKGSSVLDIGAGTGFFVDQYIKKQAGAVTGIDFAEVSVAFLNKLFPAQHFYRFDAGSDTAPLEEKFDIINVFDVLYHIVEPQGFLKAIENISRFARSGAWIFITDSFSEKAITDAHVCYRQLPEYREALRRQGIDIVEAVPVFNLMGRSPCMNDKKLISRICAKLIDSLAWFIYWIDRIYRPQSGRGIQLLICRKK